MVNSCKNYYDNIFQIERTVMKKNIFFLLLTMFFLVFYHSESRAQEVSVLLEKDHSLHSNFHNFALSRIKTINRNFMHTQDNIFIEANGNAYVGRYHEVDPSSVVIEVKQINSSTAPFIGIMQYIESVFESKGPCNISVSRGPFNPVKRRKITEIFRYVQDRWQ